LQTGRLTKSVHDLFADEGVQRLQLVHLNRFLLLAWVNRWHHHPPGVFTEHRLGDIDVDPAHNAVVVQL
jgi:hypothetical protein